MNTNERTEEMYEINTVIKFNFQRIEVVDDDTKSIYSSFEVFDRHKFYTQNSHNCIRFFPFFYFFAFNSHQFDTTFFRDAQMKQIFQKSVNWPNVLQNERKIK